MPYIQTSALAGGKVKVPDTEYRILQILDEHRAGLHAPAIARASQGDITVKVVYTLLKRLLARGLVQRRDEFAQVDDIEVKRVYYQIDPSLQSLVAAHPASSGGTS